MLVANEFVLHQLRGKIVCRPVQVKKDHLTSVCSDNVKKEKRKNRLVD